MDSLQGKPSSRAIARPLLPTLLVVVGIIMTLALAEVVLRAVDSHELHITELHPLYAYDAEIGWSMLPHSSTRPVSGNRIISVETNSLGIRERELREPRPGTFLFIGDSFTYGYDAELEERFSNLLQRELPQHLMVNAGVSGYGTDQQYLTMLRLWNRVKPQVVVLTVCIDNDRDDNSGNFRWNYHKPYFVRAPEGQWEVRGYPVPVPKNQLYRGGLWTERFLLARLAVYTYWRIRNASTITPDPTEHLVNMVRWAAEARGAQLVVGLQRHDPKLEAHLRTQKIPFTTFEEAKVYPTAGSHWTPEGNAVVASRYLALFKELGIASSLAFPGDLADRDRIGRMLDRIAGSIGGDVFSAGAVDLADALGPVRVALRAMIADAESRLAAIDSRLKQLGPAGVADGASGNDTAAEERTRLSVQLSELNSALTSTRQLAVRAQQLADQIDEHRRAIHHPSLFERTASVLSPAIWSAAGRALPGEFAVLGDYLKKSSILVWDSGGVLRGTIALIVMMALGMAGVVLWVWRHWRNKTAKREPTLFAKAISSFGVFVALALTTPALLIVLSEAVQVRMIEISFGLVCSVFVLTFGYAVAFAVLAPDAPARRLIAVDDQTAGRLARHLVWGSQALAALVFVLAAHRAMAGPPSLAVAANTAYALVIGAILLHLLHSTHAAAGGAGQPARIAWWLRALGWLVLALIIGALLTGYVNLAAFVAVRLVSLVALLGLLYLLVALANPRVIAQLAAATHGGQSADAELELRASQLGPRPALTSACIILGLTLAAIALAIGPW